MKLIYVAGPFSAPTPELIQVNINTAIAYGVKILEVGKDEWFPVIPHAMSSGMYNEIINLTTNKLGTAQSLYDLRKPNAEFWYKATMKVLNRCDAAVFIPGWQKSTGCRAELARCIDDRKPYFTMDVFGDGDESVYGVKEILDLLSRGICP